MCVSVSRLGVVSFRILGNLGFLIGCKELRLWSQRGFLDLNKALLKRISV